MARTEGQELAMRQLRSIELASTHGLDILAVREPGQDGSLRVEVSLDCAGITVSEAGIQVRGRERFELSIPPGFPYSEPKVTTPHRRWAGTAHVQWGRYPCLYVAPTVEWLPADGMFGFIDRLWLWLERAAAGTLDPAGAPLHPPVAYTLGGTPLVIPRADTPRVEEEPWFGMAVLDHPHSERYDITGWLPEFDASGELITPPTDAAAAVLLPTALDFEYPLTVHALITALHERGANLSRLLLHLGWVAAFRTPGEPLVVVVGTAMRGTAGGQRHQHLSSWLIPAEHADRLTAALGRHSKEERRRELGAQALEEVIRWLVDADLDWCPIYEDRPEIVERRDSQSPLQSFAGKRVVVWGCGALGGPIAEAVVRAGAAAVTLYDNGFVHPGVLVRQPYTDDDLGRPKARVLGERLRRIFPRTAVAFEVRNVLAGPLNRADWHDDADILIDATASATVQAKLERMRRLNPQPATIVTILIGHTAEHGVATIAGAGYSGAGADALRATKLACVRAPRLRGFLEEFWPDRPRTDLFQPEPGCSSPTFRGSGAEASALAGTLLSAAAGELDGVADGAAIAHLITLPGTGHHGADRARLVLPPATVLPDARERFQVRLAASAAAQIRAWTSSARRRLGAECETGGLLFGERDEAAGVVWIDLATGPPPDSLESPEPFPEAAGWWAGKAPPGSRRRRAAWLPPALPRPAGPRTNRPAPRPRPPRGGGGLPDKLRRDVGGRPGTPEQAGRTAHALGDRLLPAGSLTRGRQATTRSRYRPVRLPSRSTPGARWT